MSLRVLTVITELRAAGAERIAEQIIAGLPRERFEPRVVCLRSLGGAVGDGEVTESLRAAGVPVLTLRARHKLDPTAALHLTHELRAFRPHLLHGHLFHGNLVARLLGGLVSPARRISTLHVVERRPLRLRRALERATARLDHLTVCVSQAVASHARSQLGVSSLRLRVIENGVDLRRFAPPPDPAAARAAARARFDLPQDALVVGAVGRLDPQKGTLDLLDAWERLAPRWPRAVLALAGRGPLEPEVAARARRSGGRVRPLGFVTDVPAVLDALDLFVMPSRWEGFGLALAEALARGLPAVVSAVDSLPEVLGPAGRLVPPARPDRLGAALEALLRDPAARAELARQAPLQAARFSLERMQERYRRLYEELARQA
ncbi:MAG: glycosyltransferase [Planctomycetota bacterium]